MQLVLEGGRTPNLSSGAGRRASASFVASASNTISDTYMMIVASPFRYVSHCLRSAPWYVPILSRSSAMHNRRLPPTHPLSFLRITPHPRPHAFPHFSSSRSPFSFSACPLPLPVGFVCLEGCDESSAHSDGWILRRYCCL